MTSVLTNSFNVLFNCLVVLCCVRHVLFDSLHQYWSSDRIPCIGELPRNAAPWVITEVPRYAGSFGNLLPRRYVLSVNSNYTSQGYIYKLQDDFDTSLELLINRGTCGNAATEFAVPHPPFAIFH